MEEQIDPGVIAFLAVFAVLAIVTLMAWLVGAFRARRRPRERLGDRLRRIGTEARDAIDRRLQPTGRPLPPWETQGDQIRRPT